MSRRPPSGGATWHETFISAEAASYSVGSSVQSGFSVLVIDGVASQSECAAISDEASANAKREREARGLAGLVRKPACELLGAANSVLCDKLLLRILSLLDSTAAPTLSAALFGDILRASPSTVFGNARLAWSKGEPAVNVYTDGGCFTPHEDEQSLTCLVNASPRDAYRGGGTAFWSHEAARANRETEAQEHEEDPDTSWQTGGGASGVRWRPPACVLAPPAGTALVFGGLLTHAAQPLVAGERTVFVASFSPAEQQQQHATEECSLQELCEALTGTRSDSPHDASNKFRQGTP
jgi:hypothetical protein